MGASSQHPNQHPARRITKGNTAQDVGNSALILVNARLRHIADTQWGAKRNLDMNRLKEAMQQAA
jgi:hypothetical protein